MIVQNNPAPWVVLVLVIMGGCVLTGMLLGGVGPFNPESISARVQITQTQAAVDAHATRAALDLAQTQQAPIAQQTAVVAQMTAVPLQQTATRIAELDALRAAQVSASQTAIAVEAQNVQLMAQATQTAIANDLYSQNLAGNATATAIAQGQVREQATGVLGFVIVGIGTLTLCGWIVARAVVQSMAAHAQEKIAHAQLLAEQRRLASLRASIQSQKGARGQQYSTPPTSLMQKPSNGKGLPKAQ